MTSRRIPTHLLAAVLAIHAAFFVTAVAERPKVASDASSGMLVWRSMERGADWNNAWVPDPANIARDRQEFLTWWSPGQYLIVGPLHLLGLTWGAAIAVATFASSLCGLAGFWKLYLLLGFSEMTSAWAVGVLALTWQVTRNYGEFPGGEVPLFGVLPWLLALIVRLRPLRFWHLLPFAAVYFVGAMAKLSFSIAAAATLVGVACAESRESSLHRRYLPLAARVAVILATAHLLLWTAFLRFGANPSGLGPHRPPWWYAFPSTVALPAGSVFGLMSLLSRVLLFPGHALLKQAASMAPFLWIFAAGAAALYWALARWEGLSRRYRAMAGGMLFTYFAVLGGLIAAGAPISLEDRQFFPVGALLLPALVEAARAAPTPGCRRGAAAGLSMACAYGLAALVVHAYQRAVTGNVGRAGFTQHILSKEALCTLHALDDDSAPGTLIYVPSPEISFEVRRARVLSTFDLALGPEELRLQTRRGRVPLLVVLSNPVLEIDQRDRLVRNSFADYPPKNWKRQQDGEWTFYYQGLWPVTAALRAAGSPHPPL